jgi:hypothetical protein
LDYASPGHEPRRTVWLPIIALIASLSTAYQLYSLVMMAVWGRQTSALESIGLLGALVLLAGSIVAWKVRGIGVITIAIGCTMLWIFYAPAITITLGHWREVNLARLTISLLPSGFLAASTLLAAISLFKPRSR